MSSANTTKKVPSTPFSMSSHSLRRVSTPRKLKHFRDTPAPWYIPVASFRRRGRRYGRSKLLFHSGGVCRLVAWLDGWFQGSFSVWSIIRSSICLPVRKISVNFNLCLSRTQRTACLPIRNVNYHCFYWHYPFRFRNSFR